MKKILLTFALILTLATAATAFACGPVPEIEGIYAKSAAVTDLDYENDIVTLRDASGFEWTFYGCEDYAAGDIVDMVMWDNATPEIMDDFILAARYSGYILSTK